MGSAWQYLLLVLVSVVVLWLTQRPFIVLAILLLCGAWKLLSAFLSGKQDE